MNAIVAYHTNKKLTNIKDFNIQAYEHIVNDVDYVNVFLRHNSCFDKVILFTDQHEDYSGRNLIIKNIDQCSEYPIHRYWQWYYWKSMEKFRAMMVGYLQWERITLERYMIYLYYSDIICEYDKIACLDCDILLFDTIQNIVDDEYDLLWWCGGGQTYWKTSNKFLNYCKFVINWFASDDADMISDCEMIEEYVDNNTIKWRHITTQPVYVYEKDRIVVQDGIPHIQDGDNNIKLTGLHCHDKYSVKRYANHAHL